MGSMCESDSMGARCVSGAIDGGAFGTRKLWGWRNGARTQKLGACKVGPGSSEASSEQGCRATGGIGLAESV